MLRQAAVYEYEKQIQIHPARGRKDYRIFVICNMRSFMKIAATSKNIRT